MKELRVLIIEDSLQDAELILRELRRGGYTPLYKRVYTAPTVSDAINTSTWDVILSDYNMPSFSAFEALEILKQANRDIPFILISGAVGEQTAVELMKAGASDFIKKGDFARLSPAIEREIREVKNRAAKRETEAHFRHLTEAIPQLVWTADPKGFADFYNQQWFEYTGIKIKEADGYDWQKKMHPEDLPHALKLWEIARSTQIKYEVESRIKQRDGKYLWHLIRAVPIHNEEGKVTKWFGTCTDIEDQKQAVLLRDEFLSIASHELKTPITTIKLRLGITRRSIRTEDKPSTLKKMIEALDISEKQVDRLISLVEDLLDVSRIQQGKLKFHFENVSLSDLVHEFVERYHTEFEEAKCLVELKLTPNIVGHWDRSRIEQVIVNLLINAARYAPGNPIQVVTQINENTATLIIQDHGPGIPKERQAKIFERFERATSARNISGMGLGLFIVDQIIKAHGGSIGVESEVGKGAKFIIQLPLQSPVSSEKHLQLFGN